jgi:hypothetical protein
MHYNIHDIIQLESFEEILELEYFKVEENNMKVDHTDICVGNNINHSTYKDLLCSLEIESDSDIYLGVSKLLAWSRHVLYVNLVEPLLRLYLVPKGYVLIHLACLEKNRSGIAISAPPDTGKTSSILKCLQRSYSENLGLSLLSDDMIIASEDGRVLSFPKPFTMSAETLKSLRLKKFDLGLIGDQWYKIRSMVHSKGGRSTYKSMGNVEWLPIMSINALAQIIFEPPKFYPTKIMKIKIGDQAIPKKLIFLSKEFVGEKEISNDAALELIRSNTDNAYITPPYSDIFPKLTVGGMSYNDILEEEKEIIRNLIENIDPVIVGRQDYSWYEYVLNDL